MPENNNRIRTYYIYEITNNLNSKTYIGQRHCPSHETPWTDVKYMGCGKLIRLSEEKNGIENFSKKILAVCHSQEILDILEKEYIALYRSIGKAEYNIADGGLCGNLGLKVYDIVKASLTGKPKSEETKKRISESQKGRIVSEETKAKIREARKHQAPMSEESKQKFKESIAAFWNSPKGQEQKRINSEKSKGRKLTKGLHWFNNGIHNIQSKECPEGFVPGRLGDFTCSEETKQKKRDIERNMTDEQRKKRSENISKAHIGKHFTEEQKKHIGDANRGRKYYNNGIIEVMRFECPEGFVPGRCPKAKQSIKKGMNDK